MGRRPVMAIVGQGGDLPPRVLQWATQLGRLAIEAGFRVLTGGLDGVMQAASRGAHEAASYREGDVIGVLPGGDASAANAWVDIVIPSGLSMARNIVLVSTADVVVAIAGGAGTLSELAAAWQLGKPVVALGDEGWAGRLAGQAIDGRRGDVIVGAETPEQAIERAQALLRRRQAEP